jgi:biopolymer transport protein ExbB
VTGLPDLGGAFEDVVVLVALDSTRIDYGLTQDGGTDLRFVASDDETVLPYEVEIWDPQGVSFVWVRVPMVAQGEIVYMYYDGPLEPVGFDATSVWPDHYRGVWHLAGDELDSTAYGHHASGNASTRPGHIGLAGESSGGGSDDGFQVGTTDELSNLFMSGGATLSLWVRPRGSLSGDDLMFKGDPANDGDNPWEFDTDAGEFRFQRRFATGRTRFVGGTVPPYTWTHVALLYDDTNGIASQPRLLVDGIEVPMADQTPGNPSGAPQDDANGALWFGHDVPGVLDEVRVRSGGTPSEVMVDYRSQADALLTFGPFDDTGCSGPPPQG